MDRFDQDRLTAALESLRPAPTPAFAAELDERAAAGFPRRASASNPAPLRRLATWVSSIEPRRVLVPAGGIALAALVAVTVVVAIGNGDRHSQLGLAPGQSGTSAPEQDAALSPRAPGGDGARQDGSESGGGDVAGIEYSDAPPTATNVPIPKAASGAAGGVAASGSSAAGVGPYAARARHREVERSAEMVLGADADEVAGDAAKVFDTVHVYDGIVLSSSVNGGVAGHASADFDLLIPSAKLGDALAAFSAIAEVRSRHDATDDITAPTIRVGEQLRDARATIDGLLVQLAGADSETERAEVEAELAGERRHAAALRSSLAKLDRRANLSRVSLQIESDGGSSSSGSGTWGVDDALGGAGHILGIAAGVVLIGLAILTPVALIALLAWLGARAWRRRSRERVLD